MASVQSRTPFSLLIVEDEVTARKALVRMVSRRFPDCTIYSAGNSIQGLELFKQFNPDIVMTDINMPVMDGVEMIRESRLINANAKYIVLTAYSDRMNIERIKDINVTTYLLKPLAFRELFAAIEGAVAKEDVRRDPQG